MQETLLLKHHGLRETQPRLLVLRALARSKSPLAVAQIHKVLSSRGDKVNLVTVYRVLDALVKCGIVHQHPCNGLFSLCSMPGKPGHHGFLHCSACGKSEEFTDHALCALENTIAKRNRFRPSSHVSEIIGTCASCQ